MPDFSVNILQLCYNMDIQAIKKNKTKISPIVKKRRIISRENIKKKIKKEKETKEREQQENKNNSL